MSKRNAPKVRRISLFCRLVVRRNRGGDGVLWLVRWKPVAVRFFPDEEVFCSDKRVSFDTNIFTIFDGVFLCGMSEIVKIT